VKRENSASNPRKEGNPGSGKEWIRRLPSASVFLGRNVRSSLPCNILRLRSGGLKAILGVPGGAGCALLRKDRPGPGARRRTELLHPCFWAGMGQDGRFSKPGSSRSRAGRSVFLGRIPPRGVSVFLGRNRSERACIGGTEARGTENTHRSAARQPAGHDERSRVSSSSLPRNAFNCRRNCVFRAPRRCAPEASLRRGRPRRPENRNEENFSESGRPLGLKPSVFLGRNRRKALSFQAFRLRSGRKSRTWGSGQEAHPCFWAGTSASRCASDGSGARLPQEGRFLTQSPTSIRVSGQESP
jgi:hypothetical protein